MDKLDEYIEHYEMLSTEYERSKSLTEQFTQLANWLKELKGYRESWACENCKYRTRDTLERPCSMCKHNFPNMFESEDMPNEES